MKTHAMVLLVCCGALFLSSCNKEDDITSIFQGKTWYITGATINGKSLDGDDLKSLYISEDSYYMVFTANMFSGVLVKGSSFSGRWTADGKKQTLVFSNVSSSHVDDAVISQQIFNILRNVKTYSGDANVLQIQQDKMNFIRLSNTKKK